MRYLLAILLFSCYTQKKAKKDVLKAHLNHPKVTAKACTNFYPSKDSIVREIQFKEGVTDTLISLDTITENNITYIDRWHTIRKTDTMYHNQIKVQENTAKVEDLKYKLLDINLELERYKGIKKNRNDWRLAFIILSISSIGYLFIRK